jgi:hypothetical protein
VGRVVVVPRENLQVEVALLHDDVAGQLPLPAVAPEVEVEGMEAAGGSGRRASTAGTGSRCRTRTPRRGGGARRRWSAAGAPPPAPWCRC